MIKNIIFDFDGVLVDSEILVARSFCRYLSERNIIFDEKEFSKFAGKKTIQVVSELSVLSTYAFKKPGNTIIFPLVSNTCFSSLILIIVCSNFADFI